MTKTILRRYWPAALLFLLVVGVLLFPWHRGPADKTFGTPPAPVIMRAATVIDQGVRVDWLEAQAGTYPVSGYAVERSRDGGDFEPVGRVEKISLTYLDADGHAGDVYRVITEDDHQPARRSAASEQVVAAAAKPGSSVVFGSAPRVLGASTALEQAGTPDAKAAVLGDFLARAFTEFDTALNNHDVDIARSLLGTMQSYQRQMFSLLPQLSPAQRNFLVRVCDEHISVFETNLHVLPEQDQMDGMLVSVNCDVLRGGHE